MRRRAPETETTPPHSADAEVATHTTTGCQCERWWHQEHVITVLIAHLVGLAVWPAGRRCGGITNQKPNNLVV